MEGVWEEGAGCGIGCWICCSGVLACKSNYIMKYGEIFKIIVAEIFETRYNKYK